MKAAAALCMFFAVSTIASPAQTVTTLHTFDGTDGSEPYAGLIHATDGNLYGTTYLGGANDNGTVFKITPSGSTFTPLYSFCAQTGCVDGALPMAELVLATNENLYGTTEQGGANNGGTIFKITTRGKWAPVYNFCSLGNCDDGFNPLAGLIQGTTGSLYGTTEGGGTHDNGTIFKITPSGTLKTLYSFCAQNNCTDGMEPNAGLVQAPNGSFYGTTYEGGNHGGTVFKYTPGSDVLTRVYTFARKAIARTELSRTRDWFWLPMGTCTGQHWRAGPTTPGRSSRSPPATTS